ncbi:MAG TPA: ABC transporter ATP-binding protein, partial [Thermoanaerobaculia bacterium]|nr:ABC transporter ATP-binding protein [Thermoanaerobaculia bacterium]
MLRVTSLRVSYGRVPALHDVSFELPAGRIIAIVGANGSGKSTILRAIAGLNRVDRGEILIEGKPIHRLPAHRRVGLGLALVPEGRHLFPRLTVERNLQLGAYTRRDRAEIAASVENVYRTFPVLGERRAQSAGTLSGGEQQMLAIGRGLMSKPKLLMLDEPSWGIAPMLVNKIFDTIAEINRSGVSILLVEQNVQRALSLADRAYVLQTGRVVLSGTGGELLGS